MPPHGQPGGRKRSSSSRLLHTARAKHKRARHDASVRGDNNFSKEERGDGQRQDAVVAWGPSIAVWDELDDDEEDTHVEREAEDSSAGVAEGGHGRGNEDEDAASSGRPGDSPGGDRDGDDEDHGDDEREDDEKEDDDNGSRTCNNTDHEEGGGNGGGGGDNASGDSDDEPEADEAASGGDDEEDDSSHDDNDSGDSEEDSEDSGDDEEEGSSWDPVDSDNDDEEESSSPPDDEEQETTGSSSSSSSSSPADDDEEEGSSRSGATNTSNTGGGGGGIRGPASRRVTRSSSVDAAGRPAGGSDGGAQTERGGGATRARGARPRRTPRRGGGGGQNPPPTLPSLCEPMYDDVVKALKELCGTTDEYSSHRVMRAFPNPTRGGYDILVVCSPMGNGKSEATVVWVRDLPPELAILVVTSKRSLGWQLFRKLQPFGFKHYSEEGACENAHRLVVQLESLHKVKPRPFVVVLDEIGDLMRETQSSTVRNQRETYELLKGFAKSAPKLVVMDATMDHASLQFLRGLERDDWRRACFIHNTCNDDMKAIRVEEGTEAQLLRKMKLMRAAEGGGDPAFVVACTSRAKAKAICATLPEGRTKLYCRDTPDAVKQADFANLDAALERDTVHYVVYTPTCSVGVSCTLPRFTTLFLLVSIAAAVPTETVMQLVRRFRCVTRVYVAFVGHGGDPAARLGQYPTAREGVQEWLADRARTPDAVVPGLNGLRYTIDIGTNRRVFQRDGLFRLQVELIRQHNRTKVDPRAAFWAHARALGLTVGGMADTPDDALPPKAPRLDSAARQRVRAQGERVERQHAKLVAEAKPMPDADFRYYHDCEGGLDDGGRTDTPEYQKAKTAHDWRLPPTAPCLSDPEFVAAHLTATDRGRSNRAHFLNLERVLPLEPAAADAPEPATTTAAGDDVPQPLQPQQQQQPTMTATVWGKLRLVREGTADEKRYIKLAAGVLALASLGFDGDPSSAKTLARLEVEAAIESVFGAPHQEGGGHALDEAGAPRSGSAPPDLRIPQQLLGSASGRRIGARDIAQFRGKSLATRLQILNQFIHDAFGLKVRNMGGSHHASRARYAIMHQDVETQEWKGGLPWKVASDSRSAQERRERGKVTLLPTVL